MDKNYFCSNNAIQQKWCGIYPQLIHVSCNMGGMVASRRGNSWIASTLKLVREIIHRQNNGRHHAAHGHADNHHDKRLN